MATFERAVFSIPNDARHAPPFRHVYEEYVPRICNLLQCSLFYGEVVSLGKLADSGLDKWTDDALEETAALGGLNAFIGDHQIAPVPEHLPRDLAVRLFDLMDLYNEICVGKSASEFGLSFNDVKVADGQVRVESAFDSGTTLAFNKHMLEERASDEALVARAAALLKLSEQWSGECTVEFDAVVSGAPRTTLNFQAIAHDDSSITFKHWFAEPEFQTETNDYYAGSGLEYLVSEAMKLGMSEALNGDPGDIDLTVQDLVGRNRNRSGLSEIIEFQDIVLPDMPTVAERLMNGTISPAQFEQIFAKSQKMESLDSAVG